jgi:hypothetical protein
VEAIAAMIEFVAPNIVALTEIGGHAAIFGYPKDDGPRPKKKG